MPKLECVIGKYCETHDFIHGGEAEQLRQRIEKLITSLEDLEDTDGIVDADLLVMDLRAILDSVDARDAAAFLEAQS
jgi:hypothetical protein